MSNSTRPRLPTASRAGSWWAFAAGGGTLLVLSTTLGYYLPEFPQDWRLVPPFSLATEMNPAVWWSAMGLLVVTLLSYERFSSRRAGDRVPWLVLTCYAGYLAMDEIGSFHERIYSYSRLLDRAMIVAFALTAVFIVYRLWRDPATRGSAWAVFAANGLFASVIVQEELQFRLVWAREVRAIRSGVEEGTELLAIFLLLWAVIRERRKELATDRRQALVPDPGSMRGIVAVLYAGLVLHLVLSTRIVPRLTDLDTTGDPSAVFPTCCYFVLFAAVYWRRDDLASRLTPPRALLATLFLLASVGSMYPLYRFVPKITAVVPIALLTDVGLISALVGMLAMALSLAGGEVGRARALPFAFGALTATLFVVLGCDPALAFSGLCPYFLATWLVRGKVAATHVGPVAVESVDAERLTA